MEELVKFEEWAQKKARDLNPVELIDTLIKTKFIQIRFWFCKGEMEEKDRRLFNIWISAIRKTWSILWNLFWVTIKRMVKNRKSRFRTQTEYMLWMEIVRRLGDKEKEALVLTFLEKGRANHNGIYNVV